ncbi:hypothetical protein GQ600_2857 [Phytophthora cactorum]|nr:hypothetical protein GQ600_2857 [Phytophthora cactorum]
MTEGTALIYRFLQSAYSTEQIAELRCTCELRYGIPGHLRKPTEKESIVLRGILEGTIICPKLPDFLKRICIPQAYRKIQIPSKRSSGNDPAKVTAMLHEAKQICYDQGQHAIHRIF